MKKEIFTVTYEKIKKSNISITRLIVASCIALVVLLLVFLFLYFTGIAVADPKGFDTRSKGSGVEVVSYDGNDRVVKIPSAVGSKQVVSIAQRAFYNNDRITKVVVPDTVKTVGDRVFSDCDNLKEVLFKSDYTSMGDAVFENSGVEKVVLPTKLRKITDNMFKNCKSVRQISFPDTLMGIGDNAFQGCTSIKNMILGGDIKKIGENAFADCGENFSLGSVIGSETERYALENEISYTPCNDYYEIYNIYPLYTGDNTFNSNRVSEGRRGLLSYTPEKTGYYRVSLDNEKYVKFKITSALSAVQSCSEIRGNKNDYIACFEGGSQYFIPISSNKFVDYDVDIRPVSRSVVNLYKRGERMLKGKGEIHLKAGTPLRNDHNSSYEVVAEVNSDITLTQVIDYYVDDENNIWYKIETNSPAGKTGRWFKG